ncbi:MAG TPA: beta-glucosidase [Candidatus Binatia bacterium]|nr:beta-glucosidase [Candidatus Binatia bacterium]
MAFLFSPSGDANSALQDSSLGLNGSAAPSAQRQGPTSKLFDSFWMAGFESSSHITKAGVRLDMIESTQHDQFVVEDYRLLREFGFGTIRDAVRWHLIDRGSRYDFSSLAPMVEAAQKESVQVIWDICHYGWPDGVDILSPAFVDRFERFCGAIARFMKQYSDRVPFYAPINEISFFAWAAGQVGFMHPCRIGEGVALKEQLVRAAIAGIEALWAVDSRARMAQIDPIMHVVTPRYHPELAAAAAAQHASQFEAWDMLSGVVKPELGGHPRYLDIIGVNYYHANQWEYPDNRLRWEDTPRDERWIPFSGLVADVYQRYKRPMFVAETGHFGVGRAAWAREIVSEVMLARDSVIPLEGICFYPIIDRTDWEDSSHWHNCGLWDLWRDSEGRLQRVICPEFESELSRIMHR